MTTDPYLRVTATPPIRVQQINGQVNLSFDPSGEIWVRLTDVSTSGSTGAPKFYSWKQVISDGNAGWIDVNLAQEGGWNPAGLGKSVDAGPAFELNNRDADTGASTGDVVRLWPGAWENDIGQTWLFAVGSGGDDGGGGGGGGGTGLPGCGWLIDFPTGYSSCLELTILSVAGACACIHTNQKFKLYRDDDNPGHWIGGTATTCCGCSIADFEVVDDPTRPEVYGRLKLTKRNKQCNDGEDEYTQTSYILSNQYCPKQKLSDSDAANTRGILDNCNSAADGCDNHFTARITCVGCPEDNCCCKGCIGSGDFPCLIKPGSPPARRMTISGFDGADGKLLNIPWVLNDKACSFEAICEPGDTRLVTITLVWIDKTHGWRLTLTTPMGSAIYESGVGPLSDGRQDCCSAFDVAFVSVSGYTSHPSTITISPLGVAGACTQPILSKTDVNICNPKPISARTFRATSSGQLCSGIGNSTADLVFSDGGGGIGTYVYTGTGPNSFNPANPVTFNFSPSTCSMSVSAGAAGAGNSALQADSTLCPFVLHFKLCAAPAYCGLGPSFICGDNPNAIDVYLVETTPP